VRTAFNENRWAWKPRLIGNLPAELPKGISKQVPLTLNDGPLWNLSQDDIERGTRDPKVTSGTSAFGGEAMNITI
jgi:hypothetical protein